MNELRLPAFAQFEAKMVEQLLHNPAYSRKFIQYNGDNKLEILKEDKLPPGLKKSREEAAIYKMCQDPVDPSEIVEKLFINDEHKQKDLQNALIENKKVRIPGVEQVAKDYYEKMYREHFSKDEMLMKIVNGIETVTPAPTLERIKYTQYTALAGADSDDDYDLDSEDEKWIENNKEDVQITELQFESVIAKLNELNVTDSNNSKLLSLKSHLDISKQEDFDKLFHYLVEKKERSMHKTLKIPKILIKSISPTNKPDLPYEVFQPLIPDLGRTRSEVLGIMKDNDQIFEINQKLASLLKGYKSLLRKEIDSGKEEKANLLNKLDTFERKYKHSEELENIGGDEMPKSSQVLDVASLCAKQDHSKYKDSGLFNGPHVPVIGLVNLNLMKNGNVEMTLKQPETNTCLPSSTKTILTQIKEINSPNYLVFIEDRTILRLNVPSNPVKPSVQSPAKTLKEVSVNSPKTPTKRFPSRRSSRASPLKEQRSPGRKNNMETANCPMSPARLAPKSPLVSTPKNSPACVRVRSSPANLVKGSPLREVSRHNSEIEDKPLIKKPKLD